MNQMKCKLNQLRGFVLLGLIALAPFTQAAVLLSNIDEPRRADTVIQQDPDPLADPPVDLPWAAQSFSTDNNDYVLTSIEVLLGNLVGNPTPVLELRNDDGGQLPGGLITTFTLSSISAGAPLVTTLTPADLVNLAANTQYWLVVGALGMGSFSFQYAEGNNQSGPGQLLNYAYSTNQGTTWGAGGSDNPYKLRVNVENVPAPAALFLTLTGLAASGLQRKKSIFAGHHAS